MGAVKPTDKLTTGQERVLKLLFKFRFTSTQLLADVMNIRRRSVYEMLETLVSKGLVDKVYEKDFRYAKKPAYYFLNKTGVTTIRKIMDVKESVVHPLYKNDTASDEFIQQCLTAAACYIAIRRALSDGSDIFTKAEINRFHQFPKNRPDLYVRTPDGHEAIVVIVDDKPLYIIRKRREEIIAHSEDEGWTNDVYPRICFVLKDNNDKNSFLYSTRKKLDDMGMDEDELCIQATSLKQLLSSPLHAWSNAFHPTRQTSLFDQVR